MKIAFCSAILCIRGTSVALYDYADYNEILLKNESIIIVSKEGFSKSDSLAVNKFKNRFRIVIFEDNEDMDRLLISENVNLLYVIKHGQKDGLFSKKIKTATHCVFDMSSPEGDVCAGVSLSLARKFNRSLFVPHMISLKPFLIKENLRNELSIPKDAVVFGRYGGVDTFNLDFCFKGIEKVLKTKQNIYFVFINTSEFTKHERIFYLDNITSEKDKNKFINTCDAYLECGTLGHSFGLAIGEFSVNNKPIIAYKNYKLLNICHLEILRDKGIYFETQEEFENILINFEKNLKEYQTRDNNCYKEYTPELVMKAFENVFIKSR